VNTYDPLFSEEFYESVTRVISTNNSFESTIKDGIEFIIENPFDQCYTKPLRHDLSGYRSYRKGRIRIIFDVDKDTHIIRFYVTSMRKDGDKDDPYVIMKSSLKNGFHF
jgi:mRNA-degrading endonuclease RelE of RelBE toxin-antitoxin system